MQTAAFAVKSEPRQLLTATMEIRRISQRTAATPKRRRRGAAKEKIESKA
jgi:hypothetical protein